ncbi:MAG: D-alanyl-D-alanine carboxypeptidase [Gammaproteobacteria bacterium]|nr:D-alanyl-D-alanine carboxypeptidase [Gammaproteobacteria bacterium]
MKMPRIILLSLFTLLNLTLLPVLPAQSPDTPATAGALPVPKAPSVAARGYLLEDFHSGQVLAEANADERLEPASITKVMAGYAVFKELAAGKIQLSDMVTISEKAWRMEGSRMFVEVGKQVSIENLLIGMIVQSGNDATVALAEHIAGSEETFAAYMNRYAAALGMTGSHFVNASGLPDPEHYMTARDIVKLTRAMIAEFPEYYAWYSQKEFTFNGITQHNRNRLLWRDASVDGVKTGHTSSAGYCLVASAQREGMRLITVVLGADGEEARASATQALLNYGFRFFETHKLYDAGTSLVDARVWKGAQETVPLGLQAPLYVTIPRGRYAQLKAGVQMHSRIMAPVETGTTLGSVQVRLGDELLLDPPLLALQAVDEGSLWQRAIDEVKLYFE